MATNAPPNEATEIAAAQADPAAFAPLYERYADAVYGYCIRRLSDPDAAADCTSTIFMRAISNIGRFSGTSFRSWLFTIARNAVIDRYRTRKQTDHLRDSLITSQPGPEELALRRETRLELQAALVHLTGQQQDVVTLRLAGLTGQEIAEATGLSLGAVKATQVRAFARLRQLMMTEVRHA